MKRFFLDFRTLVTEQLQCTGPANPQVLLTVLELKKQLLDSIYIVSMGFGKSACIIRQLQQLQKESILLSNALFINLQGENPSEFCLLAQNSVVEILENLNLHNATYFDGNQHIPLYLETESKHALQEKIPLLQAGLKRRQISPDLQQIVLFPFLNFATYTQMHYVFKYIDAFISHLRETGGEESLLYVLLRSGLNTSAFTRYYTQKITEEVKINLSVTCQLEALYNYEGLFQGLPKKPLMYYDYRNPGSRGTVLKFIKAEINCLHNKQQLNAPKVTPNAVDYRIKTSLSVDGFAYLLRLLVEAEVIEANPRTQLIAFMAANVQTRGKGEGTISAESLATKYRQVNQTTAVGVKSLLVKMVKQAQDSFNL